MASGGSPSPPRLPRLLRPVSLALSIPSSASRAPTAPSPAARSSGSARDLLVNCSTAMESRGGGPSSPTKRLSTRFASTNNDARPTAKPDACNPTHSVEDLISIGGIKLIEEFVTFCKTKSLPSRDATTSNKGSNAHHTVRSKLFESFGQLLHDEAINAIADVVQRNNQKSCNLCKSNSEALVTSVLQIACESMVKSYGMGGSIVPPKENFHGQSTVLNGNSTIQATLAGSKTAQQGPACNDYFTTNAHTSGDDKHPTSLGKEVSETDIAKAFMSKPTPTQTPAAVDPFVNPAIDGKSKSAPAHAIKKRIHSKSVKARALPAAKLFEPDPITGDLVCPVNKDCAVEASLLDHKGPPPNSCNVSNTADLSPQLKPVKKRRWDGKNQPAQATHSGDNQSCKMKLGTTALPPVDTPAVINAFAKSTDYGTSKPAPPHLKDKQTHAADLDKRNDFLRIDLFPDNLFDLCISDCDAAEEDAKRARPAATAPRENGCAIIPATSGDCL